MPNPFRPGAAIQPTFLAGRSKQEKVFRSVLRGAPAIAANISITGLRGVGKSVLLQRLGQIAEQELNWAVGSLQAKPGHNIESTLVDLITAVSAQVHAKLSRLEKFKQQAFELGEAALSLLKITAQDVTISFSIDSLPNEGTVVEALLETTQASIRSGKNGFILMVDEAQIIHDEKDRSGEHPLSLLIAAVNSLQSQGVPVGLVLCGLPTLKTNLLKARTYTERMFRGIPVDRLTDDDARQAFLVPLEGTGITAKESLVDSVLADVAGYPYFLQLWGASLWDETEDLGITTFDVGLLESIRSEILERLDHDFYDPRIDSLTPAEQDLITLTADCPYPPLKTSDIHTSTSRNQGNVNVLMGRLADQGVVYRIQKGQYEYTAPSFHEYLIRRKARLSR
jgi:type II secretory pathway predicted ATPase ExeA